MVPELTLTSLVTFGLATWRISSMLVNEAGPWDIFLKLREANGITHDDQKNKVIIPDGFWGSFYSCIWCNSLWIGAGWMPYFILAPTAALVSASIFAISTLAILAQALTEK